MLVSKHSSCDDKVHEELLKVVTCAVARLQLNWLQKKKQALKVRADFCPVVRGRGLSDGLSPSSPVFVPSKKTCLTIVGARACGYTMMTHLEETLMGFRSWEVIVT